MNIVLFSFCFLEFIETEQTKDKSFVSEKQNFYLFIYSYWSLLSKMSQ